MARPSTCGLCGLQGRQGCHGASMETSGLLTLSPCDPRLFGVTRVISGADGPAAWSALQGLGAGP